MEISIDITSIRLKEGYVENARYGIEKSVSSHLNRYDCIEFIIIVWFEIEMFQSPTIRSLISNASVLEYYFKKQTRRSLGE